jgi:hypothetical protein
MIKKIYVFANHNVACTDENGQQVISEQGNIMLEMLEDMLKRKVITPSTVVFSSGADDREYGLSVREILNLTGKKAKRS